jgi:hypothetical protein
VSNKTFIDTIGALFTIYEAKVREQPKPSKNKINAVPNNYVYQMAVNGFIFLSFL